MVDGVMGGGGGRQEQQVCKVSSAPPERQTPALSLTCSRGQLGWDLAFSLPFC